MDEEAMVEAMMAEMDEMAAGRPPRLADRDWAAARAASGELAMDHREVSACGARLFVEPGSGVTHPEGGELLAASMMEWFSDGEGRVPGGTPGATRVLLMAGMFGAPGEPPGLLVANVPLDGGTLGDCVRSAMRGQRDGELAFSLARLLVAAETEPPKPFAPGPA